MYFKRAKKKHTVLGLLDQAHASPPIVEAMKRRQYTIEKGELEMCPPPQKKSKHVPLKKRHFKSGKDCLEKPRVRWWE